MSLDLSSATDFSKMTVVQLREQLKSRSLPTNGTKVELVERLKESIATEEKILETSDDTTGKDANEISITLDTAVVEANVLDADPLSTKIDDDKATTKDGEEKNDTTKSEESKPEAETGSKKDPIVAPAAATPPEETLDAKTKRALRFGLPISSEELKIRRAERFQLKTPETMSDEERRKRRAERFRLIADGSVKNSTETSPNSDGDLLKKRAERFGVPIKETTFKSTSPVGDVEKASLEALEKRAKRFGICSEQAEVEIKKMRRAQRFGLDKI